MYHRQYRFLTTLILTGAIAFLISSCGSSQKKEEKTLKVTATAYNSVESQTKPGDSITTAWGDQLEPGMKAIAVSRDLIEQGLDHQTPVKIEGLPGTYRVLDKMHRRWDNRIDIYMGQDVEKAEEWGKQTVEISWSVEEAEDTALDYEGESN